MTPPPGPHRSSSTLGSLVPSLMVRPSKIFINTSAVKFGKISDGCADEGASRWHTDPVGSLSNKQGME